MTEPYYQDEFVTLYHGDSLELSNTWTSADVLVTDPPYGVDFQSARRSGKDRFDRIAGDATLDVRNNALAIWGDKPALVFGTWRAERPISVRQRFIWAKGDDPGLGDLSMPWGYGDEEIYVLGHGFKGRRRSNVYRFPKVAAVNNPGHPTPKPVPLMEALLEDGVPDSWVIADAFAGSGSTLLAARNLGRRAVGVELEEKYCEIVANRLATAPLPLGAPALHGDAATATVAFEF